MAKKFIGASALLVMLLFAWTGEVPIQELEQTMRSLLIKIDTLLYQAGIEYLTLFGFLLGVFVVAYVVRPLLWFFARANEFEQFDEELRHLNETRIDFFGHFGKAYAKWASQKGNAKLPKEHNEFLKSLDYPCWLDGSAPDLSDVLPANLGKGEHKDWAFFVTLYSEIEAVRRGKRRPKLLSKGDHDEFTKKRQSLADFWNRTSENYLNGKLPRKKMHRTFENQLRAIKALSFLSVALYAENRQTGPSKDYMYELAYKIFCKGMRLKS